MVFGVECVIPLTVSVMDLSTKCHIGSSFMPSSENSIKACLQKFVGMVAGICNMVHSVLLRYVDIHAPYFPLPSIVRNLGQLALGTPNLGQLARNLGQLALGTPNLHRFKSSCSQINHGRCLEVGHAIQRCIIKNARRFRGSQREATSNGHQPP